MPNLWYKNAVVYCVDVDAFADSNGDGVGDFQGLADRLDHIEALGATCVWLLPFYPSPNKDNGYDITDYYAVDPRLGTLGDFVAFSRAARDHGLKIIVDLVVNHTSIEHPWFQASRSDPDSPFRDWYVWSKDKPADAEEGVIFPGVQDSTWTFDRKRGEYYFHRFYKHQADLNIANPTVREEIERIMGFWLELGVSGFRIDAVPFLLEDLAGPHSGWEPHRYLAQMQSFLSWRRAEAIMLAEANIPMKEAGDYFGDGDRLHMVFNFPLNQALFLGLARGQATPVTDFIAAMPDVPETAQWATFLRNHDEIDLGRLSDEERAEVFAAFGPEKDMQLYDRGIRRRLAPMLGGDERRIQMAISLMLSLPGTPVFWYGDEIGMGEDLSLPERHSVRTPMQWDDGPNAGFSRAPAENCVRPVVSEGPFAYRHVNVETQQLDQDSTLSITQKLVRARRAAREVGWSRPEIVKAGGPEILALAYSWRGGRVLTLHNLADRPATFALPGDLGETPSHPLICREASVGGSDVRLGAYGFAWLRLK